MTTTANQGDSREGGKDEREPVDLSELKNLSFGPAWEDSGSSSPSAGQRQNFSVKPGGRPPVRRDRRPSKPGRAFPKSGDRNEGAPRSDRPAFDRNRPPREPENFRPTVEVSVYADEEPFKALAHAMRTSCRTYELFDIARLILAKSERFVVVVRPWGGTSPESAVQMRLYVSAPDGLLFENQEEAADHVTANHMDRFFEIEEVEVDPPSGNFPMVNRCTVTGELLGPPNYHRYQEFVQSHFAQRIQQMSFERFQQKIETVRDEAAVAEWMEKMRKVTRFREKESSAGDPAVFESIESARRHLLSQRKDELIKEVETMRLEGKKVEQLPSGNIRRSIEACLEQQRRFPLDTANHLRGRFRRLKFHLYKRGSHGVSYVCAVKRKFRDPDMPLADGATKLIEFIETNPEILAPKLPELFLGLVPAPAASPEAADSETSASEAASKPATARQPRFPDSPELRRLNQDLRWLISEGYVTEYADGRLFAPAPMERKTRGGEPENDERSPDESISAEPAASSDTETVAPEGPLDEEKRVDVKAEAPGAEEADETAPPPEGLPDSGTEQSGPDSERNA